MSYFEVFNFSSLRACYPLIKSFKSAITIFNNKNYLISLLLFISINSTAQNQYYTTCVAFYNLENLFDCENDPFTFDDDFTPKGSKNWTVKRYTNKIKKISKTLAALKGYSKTPAVLIGLCEVENKTVIEDLLQTKALSAFDYGIAHKNSPDKRGIDVALIYDRSVFDIAHEQTHRLLLFDNDQNRIFTRDQLCVTGYLGEELIAIIVNHWPSRRGGKTKSAPNRIKAAQCTKKIIDSLHHTHNKNLKIIVMGDFNDNPTDQSLKKILQTKGKKVPSKNGYYLFNPMEKMASKGLGSLAYRDKWYVFDQMLFSNSFIETNYKGFKLYQTHIYHPKHLQFQEQMYQGYPWSTYKRGRYFNGYSDHFPIYSILIKEVSNTD